MNLQEDYCSYELSKLLKEKGFDVSWCDRGWDISCYDVKQSRMFSHNYDNKDNWIGQPTLSLAMKWLRDKHHIHIMISIGFDEDKMFYHPNLAQFDTDRITYGNPIETDFSTYEEAVEVAIKYVLENLI